MAGLFFEEFEEGQVFEHAVSRTVTEMDNVLFSTLTMNPQPLHLDEEFAKRTEFGQRLVNSLFTLGLVIGMSVGETIPDHGGDPGYDVRFPKPVFHGDIVARAHDRAVEAAQRRSRPDAGIVEFEHQGINQRGEIRCGLPTRWFDEMPIGGGVDALALFVPADSASSRARQSGA
jgi:acyl dehydratase